MPWMLIGRVEGARGTVEIHDLRSRIVRRCRARDDAGIGEVNAVGAAVDEAVRQGLTVEHHQQFRVVIHGQYRLGSGCIVRLCVDAENERTHDIGGARRRDAGQHNNRTIVIGREMRNGVRHLQIAGTVVSVQLVAQAKYRPWVTVSQSPQSSSKGPIPRMPLAPKVDTVSSSVPPVPEHSAGMLVKRESPITCTGKQCAVSPAICKVRRHNGPPAEAIDELRALRQGIAASPKSPPAASGQNRRQDAQAVGSGVDLNVIDRLAAAGAAGHADRHGREQRVDAGFEGPASMITLAVLLVGGGGGGRRRRPRYCRRRRRRQPQTDTERHTVPSRARVSKPSVQISEIDTAGDGAL